jgi:hypothetical protein
MFFYSRCGAGQSRRPIFWVFSARLITLSGENWPNPTRREKVPETPYFERF